MTVPRPKTTKNHRQITTNKSQNEKNFTSTNYDTTQCVELWTVCKRNARGD